MDIRYYTLLLISLAFLCGCAENKNGFGNSALLKKTEYVTEFPYEISPVPEPEIKYNLDGALDLLLSDSLLFVSGQYPDGYIRSFDRSDGNERSRFLFKGNGPNEVHDVVYFSTSTLIRGEDGPFLWINDEMGHLKKLDLRRSSNENKTVIADTVSIPSVVLASAKTEEDGVFYTTLNENRTSIIRHFMNGQSETSIPAFEDLNALSIGKPYDGFLFNLLSTHVSYGWKARCLVEASVYMNTIHVYAVDGSFAKTICLGEKPSDLEQLESQGLRGMLRRTYMLKSYPDFFAVLVTETPGERAYDKMALLVFDWSGSPLLKVNLTKPADAFDIDLEAYILYTLSWEDESLFVYDISGN